jgi:hypothetical protein
VNISILEDSNQNRTAGQKLLLEWHYRFCHLNFQSLQHFLRRAPFVAKIFAAAVKYDYPKCEIYEQAKVKRRPKKDLTQTRNPERDGALKSDHLSPGLRVSVDHFELGNVYGPVILMAKLHPKNTKEGIFIYKY